MSSITKGLYELVPSKKSSLQEITVLLIKNSMMIYRRQLKGFTYASIYSV